MLSFKTLWMDIDERMACKRIGCSLYSKVYIGLFKSGYSLELKEKMNFSIM